MREVQIRRPNVTISSPLGETSTDELTVNIAINANTSANFAVYSGNEASSSATKVLASEAANLMGQAQNIGFSKRTNPDTTIQANDGAKSRTWSMFLTGPTYLMNTTSIKPGMAAVASAALIANLKLDIYTTNTGREEGNSTPLNEGLLVIQKKAESKNLASRLKELTQMMISFWEKNADADGYGPSTQLKKQRHTINLEGPLKLWYKMLDNSVAPLKPTEEWIPVFKGALNEGFNNSLLSILRGQAHDFEEIIQVICSDFQLVVVPDENGGPGKFVPMDHLVVSAPKPLDLPANSVLLNGDVSQDLLPVQQVMARSTPYPALLSSLDANKRKTDAGDYLVGGFPEVAPSASGDVAIVPLPMFLSEAVKSAPNPSGKLPPDKDRIESGYSDVLKLSLQFSDQLSQKLVNNYCRSIYIDMALGGSSTSIQIPMDVSMHVGDRYDVSIGGSLVFTGFLAGLTHTIKKSTGGGGTATTLCQFTHIMFPGFKLPEV